MSRTYRRKNAWNEKDAINLDDEWIHHLNGENTINHISWHRRKYNGCTDEQVRAKLKARFHSDSWHVDGGEKAVKRVSRKALKAINKMKLIEALKRVEEGALQLSDKKAVSCLWWYYC